MDLSALSSPASMKRLLGIHITPPDLLVEPPKNGVFSRTTTDLPAWRITSPELIDPAPLPTTTQSTVSSKPDIFPSPYCDPFPARSGRIAVDPATGALREIRSGAYEMYEQGGG